ncbi:hypothetical protein [Methylobacter sp.]|uniref:hypothetical protein n=1 Tax=Methylobacter sp. TaxID=2051955 RepID=UPI002FDD1773
MSGSLIVLGDVKRISFDELRIEHGVAGESNYRMLTIESGNGDKLEIKLCGDEYSLKSIDDKEFDRFCAEDRDVDWNEVAEVAL